jgi:hypothetical protein
MKRIMDLSFPIWSRLSFAACALALILSASQVVSAQQGTAKQLASSAAGVSQPKAELTETAAGEAKPAQSGHEGITVHGHWVIDVRNPDGSLAQHREFENSLINGGPQVLSQMLAGAVVPGNWAVLLGPSSGNGPCSNTYVPTGGTTSTASEICEVVQSLTTAPGVGDCQQNLCAVGLTVTGPQTTAVLLSGTIVSNQTGTIGAVSTTLAYCINQNVAAGGFTITPTPYIVSPAACVTAATQASPFTSTTLTTVLKPGATPTPNPIPVTAGQTILASVTISFS